jgi:hypothetical protein
MAIKKSLFLLGVILAFVLLTSLDMVYANEVTEGSCVSLSVSALPSCIYGPHALVNDYIKKCVLISYAQNVLLAKLFIKWHGN